jgi:hypothetical protein
MITSEVTRVTQTKKTIKFPMIVEYNDSGLVVMLQGDGLSGKYAGTVLASDMPKYPVGFYCVSWWKGGFRPFEGRVVMTNNAA